MGFDGVAIVGVVALAAVTLNLAYNDTDIQDAQRSLDIVPSTFQHKHFTQAVVDELGRTGVVVVKNVLSQVDLKSARQAALSVISDGRLEIVTGNLSSVRQDTVCFVRQTDGTSEAHNTDAAAHNTLGEGLDFCIELLRGTTSHLESLGYKRSTDHRVPMQCQLAQYIGNGEASYTAHRDAAPDDNFYDVGLLGW